MKIKPMLIRVDFKNKNNILITMVYTSQIRTTLLSKPLYSGHSKLPPLPLHVASTESLSTILPTYIMSWWTNYSMRMSGWNRESMNGSKRVISQKSLLMSATTYIQ